MKKMMQYTLQSLRELVENFDVPVPLYDSDDEKTRKIIGVIDEVWLEASELMFKARLFDGKEVKIKAS